MIAYNEDLLVLHGVESVLDVLILSQLIYWAKKMDGKEFYKSDTELAFELRISVDTLRRHKKNFKGLTFLVMKNKGIPKQTFYLISLEILEKDLLKALENSIYVKSAGMLMRNCQQRYCQSDGNITVKSAGIYIEHKTTTEITTEETPTPFSEPQSIFPEPEKSPRATNEFLELKAQKFLDLTALDDLKPTEEQTTITMFKTRLQVLLRQHDKTLEDFMDAARHHYVTERPNQPQYVIRPQNFIERTKDGIKQCPWLDHVGKSKSEKKNEITMEEARQKILSGEW